MIWVGSSRSSYGRPWQFAQFQYDSIQVLLYMLDKMKISCRGDPIMVQCVCVYMCVCVCVCVGQIHEIDQKWHSDHGL